MNVCEEHTRLRVKHDNLIARPKGAGQNFLVVIKQRYLLVAMQTFQSPLYVSLLSGSAVLFAEGDFGNFSSVSNHSPVEIAPVTTKTESRAEIPEVMPNPVLLPPVLPLFGFPQ